MSPEAKKRVSALLVAVATAVIGQACVLRFSPEVLAVVAPVLVGLAHYVNAFGHEERVEAKALELATEAVSHEPRRVH
jgi:uncharacterized membrane protein YfcA